MLKEFCLLPFYTVTVELIKIGMEIGGTLETKMGSFWAPSGRRQGLEKF